MSTANTMKTTVLMAALFGLFMAVGGLIGRGGGLVVGFLLAAGLNFFAYWFSDKVALAMSGAQEVTEAEAPELFHIVRKLAAQAGLPMPRVYITPSPQPNAFATGRDPHHAAVAVTQGILQALTPDELEAVLSHEMAHVQHRDILISSVAATIAGAISLIVQILQFEMFFGGYGRGERRGGNPLALLAAIIVAPIAATLIQLAISRSREYEADRGGALISRKPLELARALAKLENYAQSIPVAVNPASAHMYIVNPLAGTSGMGLAALFRTHPPTEERIARLQRIARDMGQIA
ncbi:MAG: zinc metalloprotease HtpX [Chthonomonadales bacterium]